MTTVDAPNVHAVAVDGTFDDCQDLVKAMFNDAAFRERMSLSRGELDQLGAGHGPGRVLRDGDRSLAWPVTSACRRGNFGNVFAGWIAQRMGAPIERLRRRVQRQRHPHPLRQRRRHDAPARSCRRSSPSMDIQVSSNFERLLFEMNGRDGGLTAEQLRASGERARSSLEADQPRERWIDGVFRAARLDDSETLDEIRRTYDATGMLVDPHTATWPLARATAALAGDAPGGDAGHGAPGQVPRRRRAGDRRTAAAARPPRRPLRRPEHVTRLPNDLAGPQQFVETHVHP